MSSVPSPIQTLSANSTIHGIPTTVTAQGYQDKILIMVSQAGGKVGSLTQASLPSSISLLPPSVLSTTLLVAPLPPNLPTPHPSTTLLPLMGTAPSQDLQSIYEMYVNQLAAIVWNDEGDQGAIRRPVVVGMALKLVKEEEKEAGGEWKLERERFAEVVKMVQACRIW